jgi:hypothetical protein
MLGGWRGDPVRRRTLGLKEGRAASRHSGWHPGSSAAHARLVALGLARQSSTFGSLIGVVWSGAVTALFRAPMVYGLIFVFDRGGGDGYLHLAIGPVAFILGPGIEFVRVSVAAGGWRDQGLRSYRIDLRGYRPWRRRWAARWRAAAGHGVHAVPPDRDLWCRLPDHGGGAVKRGLMPGAAWFSLRTLRICSFP